MDVDKRVQYQPWPVSKSEGSNILITVMRDHQLTSKNLQYFFFLLVFIVVYLPRKTTGNLFFIYLHHIYSI